MKRSKCHYCSQPITEKVITGANDAAQYIGNYGVFDDDLVWIAKDGNAICYAHDVAHCTTKEWYSGQ
jgi:hypothetical protein